MDEAGGKILVEVDEEILDLVPGFLENRRKDVDRIREAAASGDFATARRLGHSMKGAGGGNGFNRITEIGAVLEEAAERGDVATIERELGELASYLERVEVVSG
jgi:HPt (histidine-containing phosphotransfer) domain-containing protein